MGRCKPLGSLNSFFSYAPQLSGAWRRQWHPTPVLLPRKSHGQRSLVGYRPWGCQESYTTEWLYLLTYYLGLILFPCSPCFLHSPSSSAITLGGGRICWIAVLGALLHIWRPEIAGGCDISCWLIWQEIFLFHKVLIFNGMNEWKHHFHTLDNIRATHQVLSLILTKLILILLLSGCGDISSMLLYKIK